MHLYSVTTWQCKRHEQQRFFPDPTLPLVYALRDSGPTSTAHLPMGFGSMGRLRLLIGRTDFCTGPSFPMALTIQLRVRLAPRLANGVLSTMACNSISSRQTFFRS